MGESVKVAVRVRPFNQRETQRNAKLVIDMVGATTIIKNPDNASMEPHKFTFDFSYWSHDDFTTLEDGVLEATSERYASQRRVYNDLGQGVLDNAFKGFNCSLFAYGQTGSGKSYSMVGYGPNRGIVPITCDELFKAITKSPEAGVKYEIMFSMLEIYNEQVRDLLSKGNPKGGLKIRQDPAQGMFYVPELRKVPVACYEEIEKRMAEGTSNRTVASTNMNATSSRAHTVVTVVFSQVFGEPGTPGARKKTSVINLVDLAGSERADSTGAVGDRLKEGANINQSLSTLGKVISQLAEGQKMIPYRESALTKLLKNALGGNSKTVMIAALSPADINYDETLGTLRYADRAKQIKTKAVVNENPLDKLIRQLREENEQLKAKLTGGLDPTAGSSLDPAAEKALREEIESEVRERLLANQYKLTEANTNFDDQLRDVRAEVSEEEERVLQATRRRQKVPHFLNLNADPQLSRVVEHFLPEGETLIGRLARSRKSTAGAEASTTSSILLDGISIQQKHCEVKNNDGMVTLAPLASNAETKVNGQPLVSTQQLRNNDRVVFGNNHYYLFVHPTDKEMSKNPPGFVDFQYARQEIAEQRGLVVKVGEEALSKEEQLFRELVVELMPMISEANAISEELNKYKTFEIVVMPVEAKYGKKRRDASTLPVVMMRDLLNGNCWHWYYGTFLNRRYMIQETYQKYVDGEIEDPASILPEEDPFWEPPDPVFVGTACVYLQSLAYGMDFKDKLTVCDYHNNEQGTISVGVEPCKAGGGPVEDDYFVEDPEQLLGKPFYFNVMVDEASLSKDRFSQGIFVRYRTYCEDKYSKTEVVSGTLDPVFKHSHCITIDIVNEHHLNYFDDGCVMFHVYAIQSDLPAEFGRSLMTTKELRKAERLRVQTNPTANARPLTAVTQRSQEYLQQMKAELFLLRTRVKMLGKKEKRIQELVEEWASKPKSEQSFRGFNRAVNAAAFSTGSRWKTVAKTVGAALRMSEIVQERRRSSPQATLAKVESMESAEPLVALPEVVLEEEEEGAQGQAGRPKSNSGSSHSSEDSTPLALSASQPRAHEYRPAAGTKSVVCVMQ